jgi:hypothetical protein
MPPMSSPDNSSEPLRACCRRLGPSRAGSGFARALLMLAAGPLFALGLAGCAVRSLDGDRLPVRSEAFADYVEAVFRRQNEVATELAFAFDNPDLDDAGYARLEAAETNLLEACRGLNQIAQRRRDGDPLGGLGALSRARQAPECERATLAAEDALGEQ